MNDAFERLIIQSIDRKITTGEVLLDITPNIIADYHTILIGIGIIIGWSTKGCHFDKLASRIDMRQLKAATDNAATLTEDVFYLMWLGIGDGIKILGL